jgi:hypothetical protein
MRGEDQVWRLVAEEGEEFSPLLIQGAFIICRRKSFVKEKFDVNPLNKMKYAYLHLILGCPAVYPIDIGG